MCSALKNSKTKWRWRRLRHLFWSNWKPHMCFAYSGKLSPYSVAHWLRIHSITMLYIIFVQHTQMHADLHRQFNFLLCFAGKITKFGRCETDWMLNKVQLNALPRIFNTQARAGNYFVWTDILCCSLGAL